MTSYVTDGSVGLWAKEKLECLGRYLAEYTRILNNQSHWCEGYFYIDAFAGSGAAPLRTKSSKDSNQLLLPAFLNSPNDINEIEYLKGSPRVALDLEIPFTKYYFIDLAKENISDLVALQAAYTGKRNVEVLHGDANEKLISLVSHSGINWKKNRAFVFLDPFGMQLPWSTLEILARTEAIEVLVNIPLGTTIQRLLPKDARPSKPRIEILNKYFGSDNWMEKVYKGQSDLFGSRKEIKAPDADRILIKLYRDQLKQVFGFASTPRLIKNTKGGHLYYLVHATPNAVGNKIANHILSMGEKI